MWSFLFSVPDASNADALGLDDVDDHVLVDDQFPGGRDGADPPQQRRVAEDGDPLFQVERHPRSGLWPRLCRQQF